MKFPKMRQGWLLLAALLVAGSGCYDNKTSYGTDPQQTNEAQDFWAKIHTQGYRARTRAPGHEQRTASSAPHGDSVDVFVNALIATTLTSGQHPTAWPVGSIIVKDGFAGGVQTLVAAIEKRSDGWFWAEYHPDGSVLASGHPSGCIGCHSSGSDFVRAFHLP